MDVIFKKLRSGYRHHIKESTVYCCGRMKLFANSDDIYFTITNDSYYDLLSRDWISTGEPYIAIAYKVPSYYGEVNTEYLPINNCPFCGSKIKIKEDKNG